MTSTYLVQVIERSVFGELLGEIPKECVECVKLDAVNLTEAEAKLLNEINLKHTSGCFGKDIFSTRDKMVQRECLTLKNRGNGVEVTILCT